MLPKLYEKRMEKGRSIVLLVLGLGSRWGKDVELLDGGSEKWRKDDGVGWRRFHDLLRDGEVRGRRWSVMRTMVVVVGWLEATLGGCCGLPGSPGHRLGQALEVVAVVLLLK